MVICRVGHKRGIILMPLNKLKMHCTNCGSSLPLEAKFCTKCGSPVHSTYSKVSTTPNDSIKQGIELSKVFIILGSILLGLTILGGLGIGLTGGGEEGSISSIFRLLVNWLLAIFFIFSILGFLGGMVLGVVFLLKSRENTAKQNYYKRNAIWAFVGPFAFIVAIVMMYIIIQIVYRFSSGTTT